MADAEAAALLTIPVADAADTAQMATTRAVGSLAAAAPPPGAGWVHVHGHREGGVRPADAVPGVWALESRVEHGGHLSVLEVTRGGREVLHTYR